MPQPEITTTTEHNLSTIEVGYDMKMTIHHHQQPLKHTVVSFILILYPQVNMSLPLLTISNQCLCEVRDMIMA